jgi:glycosyltransferase involved in cell wall biosynthesis
VISGQDIGPSGRARSAPSGVAAAHASSGAREPVRVLFLASTMRRGGAERTIVETAVELQRSHGFKSRMICLREEGPLGEELRSRGVGTESRLIGGRMDPSGFFRLRRAMTVDRPHVLYMLDHRNAVLYGVPASLSAGIKHRVMAVHTMGLPGGRRSVPSSVRAMLPWIDAVVTVASGQRRYLEDSEGIPSAKMAIVPNGVDINRFRPPGGSEDRAQARKVLGLPEDGPLVATLSVLRPEKGHELFLESVASMERELPDAVFAIMGDGPERERLQGVAARLGLDARVRFTGWVSETEVALRAVDVLVFSSEPVVETAPLAALEAMASGVPVVASDVGSLREIVTDGETGFLFPPGDGRALAERIRALLSDEALRKRMSLGARDAVERGYRLDASVAASAALLRGLARGEKVSS